MDTTPNYINHVVIVLDMSYSMDRFKNEVVTVTDAAVSHLAQRSKELDQETRVTEYTFNADNTYGGKTRITCIHYDKDVLRLPSLRSYYEPDGSTPLIDATQKAIDDLEKVPELYGDHAFLIYVVTDGEENASKVTMAHQLRHRIQFLPDNWTLAVLVPNQSGVHEAKKFGFPPQNISVWDATSIQGLNEAGHTIRRATENFMQARQHGVRGSRNLFQLDVSNLNTQTVNKQLTRLTPGKYTILPVSDSGWEIGPFVSSVTGKPYPKGAAYYQVTKPETVQGYKQVCVLDTKTGGVFVGNEARSLLGLPDYEVRVKPADHPQYELFIQSTSVNRKLVPGTKLLLLK